MLELNVNLGERSYPIFIAPGVMHNELQLKKFIGDCRPVIVTNDTISPLYLETFKSKINHLSPLTFILPDGEQFKTLSSFEKINAFLLQNNCGRDTCLVALGGGVIGDLTGFVAACYQRGVPFIQVPTTLLSQVDSSVGGKTAVNHPLGKNMIGAFYQPSAVFIDTNSLSTLASREFSAGMAEVIKYGLIYDTELFLYIENNVDSLKSLNKTAIQHIIQRCCQIKADIVALDEKESGIRALLNLGHTFGHAIEAQMGYGVWLHGEAVAAGIVMACKLAKLRGNLLDTDVNRVIKLLSSFDLPIAAPDEMSYKDFISHMKKDKKNLKGTIRFILPIEFGRCALESDVTEQQLKALF
ncbi:3-dehydroquinate synthase [Pseudoalteromonas denitrificans]|uniref:3-dehydroquinate synthase n=1 Tax=Pseudoalteromonas denitrificans DSM 6059 TaxID=1123010 RepID=A0A1I1JWY8_9GAMM|nr:3-dehydroquinate synthase [Pseudoalteromonas denitrificans]SFC53157.1 3-dehydroquinate synthase [Pseudoalteromonas denitrificans DSM 6059]